MEIEPDDRKTESQQRMSFDEVPVGRKSNQNMFADQHPPGYVEAAPVQEELPLEKRLASKVWKFRQSALNELIQQCQKGDENVARFEQQMAGWLTDSNVNCQERAFRLLDVYLSKRQKLGLYVKDLLKVLIEKGFTASKTDIVRHANNALVELLDKGYKAEIYSALIDGLSHKNPKVPVACVEACVLLLNNFGPKRLDMLKVILKELQEHCQTTSTLLRNALINFYKEAYKWLGEGLIQFVKLKKPAIDQFDKFTKTYQRIPMVPLRATEQQAASIEAGKVVEVDAYSMADPVDVIGRYDDSWVDKTLEIAKWSEKKEALDTAIAELSTPKIVPRDHYHLVGMMKKLLVDSNIAILICGLRMARALASGLRKAFIQGAKIVSSLVIGKLRDKKNQITDEAHKTLKALLLSITLEDMLEPIKQGLADKSPSMRHHTLKFLQTSLAKKDGKMVRSLMDTFLRLTSDGAAEVRQKVIEVIEEIKNIFGSGFIGDKFKDVQSQKLQKMLAERNDIMVENFDSAANQQGQRTVSLEPKLQKAQQPKKQGQQQPLKTTSLQPQPQPTAYNSRSVESPVPANFDDSFSHSHSRLADSRANNHLQPQPNIGSTTQSVKLQAYQSLISKPIANTVGFLRSKTLRESNHNILRAILTIYEKSGQELCKADLEYLVLHDWRKCKNFLSDFLLSAKIGHDCGEVIRQHPLLRDILGVRDSNRPKVPLAPELHSYLPKMMHERLENRLSAAQALLNILSQYKPIGDDFLLYTKETTQLCNVIKCRLSDPQPQSVKKYIAVTRMLTRVGIANKTRGRVLMSTIVSRIGDPRFYLEVREYMNESLVVLPGFLFGHFPTMLSNEPIRMHLLQFIEENLPQFVMTAEMKPYLAPLTYLLDGKGEIATKAEKILDYIVQMKSSCFLESALRQLRLDAPEAYLTKWGIDKSTLQQPLEPVEPNNRTSLTRIGSKSERLRDQPLDPWPLIPSPNHIYQLAAMLVRLPYPFNEMGTLLPASTEIIQKLSESPLLPDYSDLVMKWLFWRFQIEREDVVLQLIGLAKRMIATVELQEMELIILLAGLLGVVRLGLTVLKAIDQLHRQFKLVQQQKALRFWVNFIKDSRDGVNEILQVLMLCFHGALPSELLVELAAHQSVRSNSAFIKYLFQHYDRRSLQVYGFDIDESAIKARSSVRLSRRDENHRPTNNRLIELVDCFRTKDTAEVMAEIGRATYPKSSDEKALFYVELWQALYHPILQSEVKPANFIAFNVHVAKEINQIPLEAVMGRATRVLLDLLMQVDQRKPTGHVDIIKSVNNAMLRVLQVAPNQPMVEVMLTMIRQQLSKSTEYSKVVGVMCKCLGKLVKYQQFNPRIEWFMEEVLRLFNDFYFNYPGQESPNHKVLRQTVTDAINNSLEPAKHRERLRELLKNHTANEFLCRLFQDIVSGKPKETLQDSLLTRLNIIKAKCGVDDIRLGPNIFEKKNPEQQP